MSFPWRSATTAWILLIGVGALAVHLSIRVRSLEEEVGALGRKGVAHVGRSLALEGELRVALAQRDGMAKAVREKVEEQERERRLRDERRRAALEPMPEGVRLALIAIQECLQADGHYGLRVIRARSLQDHSLGDVEVLDYDRQQLITTLYVAGRLEIELDRSTSTLALRFFEGHLLQGGERRNFPPGGFELLLPGVNGPLWEARLPFLVEALESYPEQVPESAPQSLDPSSRRQWQRRLDLLLDEAETVERMRIGNLAALEEGSFRDILLLGYDDRSLLVMSAHADRMVVRVDGSGGMVQLVLRDGILRMAGGDTPIGESGYRILLPGVSPERARDIMMGMVAER